MIDVEGRKVLAGYLADLVSGKITSFTYLDYFDDHFHTYEDIALMAISDFGWRRLVERRASGPSLKGKTMRG